MRCLPVLGLLLTFSCARSRPETPAPAERRAALLYPGAAFWRSEAPAVFDAVVETSRGAFTIEVERTWAPRGADRFYNLVRAGYFDDSRFTRVVANFIAQFGIAGEPAIARRWATETFPDDPVVRSNTRGTIGFAMTGPNTRTTQLYINLVDNSRLDAQGFSPIGRVVDGMAVVDSLYSGYGERSGGGVRRGSQGPLIDGGNAYVDREYPKLDRIVRVEIVRRVPTHR